VDVLVRVPTALREHCGGKSALDVTLAQDATIGDLLDHLAERHPALERRIRDEQAALRVHVNLFVGGDNVRALHGLATVLQPGDEVAVLAAISGG
jgi:molybdopterin synthase sulfur carrier subunit